MEAVTIETKSFPSIKRKAWLERLGAEPAPSGQHEHEFDSSGLQPRPGAGLDWKIVQRIDDPDPARANRQALEDLENGADGLALVFAGAPNAFGYGLPATPHALRTAIAGIPLDQVHLRIDVHPLSRTSVDWMVDIFSRWPNVDPARLSLSFGVDPAAVFAGTGRLRMSIEALQASMPQSLAHFFSIGAPAVLLEADGRVVHNAGATDAQELGVMLASAVAHLRMFQEARQPLVYAAPHIGFTLAAGQDVLGTAVKIRALRRLWASAQEICALPTTPAAVHAETSYRMMSRHDPEANRARATLAALAAAAGGADTISVLPHSLPCGLPDGTARRQALVGQSVTKREARLGPLLAHSVLEMADAMTAAVCEAAWEEFRRIENEGGILNSLLEGRIQERVLEARAVRAEAVRGGQNVIVGATIFKSGAESPVDTLPAEQAEQVEDGTVFCQKLSARRTEEDVLG